MRVSSNGVDYSASNATYEYVDAHHVHDVLPRSGSVNGGTLLNVSGIGFKNTSALFCRFGSLPPVEGVYISTKRVQCISPMHQIGSVSIEVTTNGVDYSEIWFNIDITRRQLYLTLFRAVVQRREARWLVSMVVISLILTH